MKRNANLTWLSKDHHFGLLFCWKIRRGIALGVPMPRIRAYIAYFWAHHLERHFREEEEILFLLKEDALCERARAEHRQIEKMIGSLADGPVPDQGLQELADLVDRHIRYEERELFPYLESNLTDRELDLIGKELQRLHMDQPRDSFEDAFWLTENGTI